MAPLKMEISANTGGTPMPLWLLRLTRFPFKSGFLKPSRGLLDGGLG
jgi:hypothetical protein